MITNLLGEIYQFISQQPEPKAAISVLAVVLLFGLVVLFARVMGKAILSDKASPFIRFMETAATIVSLLAAWNLYKNSDSSAIMSSFAKWIIFVIVVALGGLRSWRALKWAADHDRSRS
jgi:chromate transport protein ChrA